MDPLRGRGPGTLGSRARGFLTYTSWLGQRCPDVQPFPEDEERRTSLLYEETMVDRYQGLKASGVSSGVPRTRFADFDFVQTFWLDIRLALTAPF